MKAHRMDRTATYVPDDLLADRVLRGLALSNDASQVLYPWWTEKVISGKGVEHYWRGEKPPTLIDPSPIWNEIYRMLADGARIPVSFTHFAWRPFERLWLERRDKIYFDRCPSRLERLYLNKLLVEHQLKERDDPNSYVGIKPEGRHAEADAAEERAGNRKRDHKRMRKIRRHLKQTRTLNEDFEGL